MTPHDLLANFEVLAEAPNGIQRLRELVLELAVRGKLVEQDPGDESAVELLKRIKDEKTRLAKAGQARAGKPLPVIEPTDIAVPRGWASIRFGECIELISGQHLSPGEYHLENKGLPYLTGPADFGLRSPVPSRWTFETRAVAEEDDILVTVKGAGIGKANVLDVARAAISRQLMAARPILIDRDYTYLCIRASFVAFQEKQVGIAIPGIGREDVLHHQIMLPPLSEQRRIVARVDELMALLDRLEAKRQDRDAARAAARDSALAALREASTPDDVEVAWLRIQERFHEFFATAEAVEPLRQAILQLAVLGRLVSHGPFEESAPLLLKRVAAGSGTANRSKKSKAVSLDDASNNFQPFELPGGWAWAHLEQLGETTTGSTPPYSDGDASYGGEIPFVKPTDLNAGYVVDRARDSISDSGMKHMRLLPAMSVLVTCIGATIGKTGLARMACVTNQQINALSVDPSLIVPEFIYWQISSPYFQRQILDNASSTTLPILNKSKFGSLNIAVPPRSEQLRIVARLEELMETVDLLMVLISNQQSLSGAFAAAAVHHLEI